MKSIADVMGSIPNEHHAAIRNRTCEVDLAPFIQEAVDAAAQGDPPLWLTHPGTHAEAITQVVLTIAALVVKPGVDLGQRFRDALETLKGNQ